MGWGVFDSSSMQIIVAHAVISTLEKHTTVGHANMQCGSEALHLRHLKDLQRKENTQIKQDKIG